MNQDQTSDYRFQQNVSYSVTNSTISANKAVNNGSIEITGHVQPPPAGTVGKVSGEGGGDGHGYYVDVEEPVNHSHRKSAHTSTLNRFQSQDPECSENPSYMVSAASNLEASNGDLVNDPRDTSTSNEEERHTYDDTVTTEGTTGQSNGVNLQSNDVIEEEVYETMDDYLVPVAQQPPPSYEYVVSTERRGHRANAPGGHSVRTNSTQFQHQNGYTDTDTEGMQVVSPHKARHGGEYYRLSIILLTVTLVLCQFPALFCVIPAIVFSVKARKMKSSGDITRARRLDKYSLRFLITATVYIVVLVILVVVAPILVGAGIGLWLLITCLCCIT